MNVLIQGKNFNKV